MTENKFCYAQPVTQKCTKSVQSKQNSCRSHSKPSFELKLDEFIESFLKEEYPYGKTRTYLNEKYRVDFLIGSQTLMNYIREHEVTPENWENDHEDSIHDLLCEIPLFLEDGTGDHICEIMYERQLKALNFIFEFIKNDDQTN